MATRRVYLTFTLKSEESVPRRKLVMSSVDRLNFESTRLRVVASSHLRLRNGSDVQSNASAKPSKSNKSDIMDYRDTLPAVMVNRKEISLWSILKSCVGKDLTKMTFPVVMNEPISIIQRLSEYMEYCFLLDKAARSDNPVERLELICGFMTSALSSNWMRTAKPFNPILGETFELVRPDMGFKYLGEQVSHHPPVTAFHVEGPGYEFHGSIMPGLSFWGKSVDVTPKGTLVVDLKKYNETYSWQNIHCFIHNILMGELWMELHGHMNIVCNKSEMHAAMTFKEAGWYSKDLHFVEGQILQGKKLVRIVYGSWVKGMYSCTPEAYENFKNDSKTKTKILNELKAEANKTLNENAGMPVLNYNFKIPNQRTLWEADEKLLNAKDYYNFSLFTMALNQLPKDHKKILPPTDSRMRPDQRLFENGKIQEAENEKVRIETKQRNRKPDEIKPLWFRFQRMPTTGKEDWVFNKDYWKRDWSKCPDLF
ncbi:hypothetical protein RRG08_028133 [Elysia crispata]|uniref:Oxysterol-binding protein n=1 Tax=Elysia crispata TaxID=231223 RepID=A0AAE0YXP6_9GAST|nr:hypothetical protein RRG08_028133 [Elysia crispata]